MLDAPRQEYRRARGDFDPPARDQHVEGTFQHVERLVLPVVDVARRLRARLLDGLDQREPVSRLLARDEDGDACLGRLAHRGRWSCLQTVLVHGYTSTLSDGPRFRYSG